MRNFYYYTTIILQKIGYAIFFVLYKIFVSIEIRGRKHLDGLRGPIILASNHTSELDVTALPLILPFFSSFHPIYFVSNRAEKYRTFGWRSYFYGGVFFNLLGGYSVYSGYKDYATALEDHITLLKNDRTVCIFPEGRRTRDGQLNPAHGGMGYMAYTTSAIVVPVAIDTFFNLSFYDFITRKRKVTITVGKPLTGKEIIPMLEPTVDDFRHAGQIVLDRIGEALE